MSAVAHPVTHVRPAALVPVAVALVTLAVVLAVVLLVAPWRAVAPAATSPLTPPTPASLGGGAVAACPHLPVSPC